MRLIPLTLLLLAACAAPITPFDDAEPPVSTHDPQEGRDLFLHSWVENDARSVDGNGLGPIFNARSCVACHAQGGVGGAGGRHQNVDANLLANHQRIQDQSAALTALSGLGLLDGGDGSNVSNVSNVFGRGRGIGALGGGLGGFGARGSRQLSRLGGLGGTSSRFGRNTPALFGAGLIDAVPDDVILAQATHVLPDPGVKGRVGLDEDGRVTRFGWKGEVAHLRDFVTQACALEIGLTVPGRPELPGADDDTSPGLDLDDAGVDALTAFVSTLPSPEARAGYDEGRALFGAVGCTGCHVEDMGAARGVYSDLLLHNMGPRLASGGSVYGETIDENASFWRTPPLWGVRDSGPWLHDGRADTLIDAVMVHGGEAHSSTLAFGALTQDQQKKILRFLESLVAPGFGDV